MSGEPRSDFDGLVAFGDKAYPWLANGEGFHRVRIGKNIDTAGYDLRVTPCLETTVALEYM